MCLSAILVYGGVILHSIQKGDFLSAPAQLCGNFLLVLHRRGHQQFQVTTRRLPLTTSESLWILHFSSMYRDVKLWSVLIISSMQICSTQYSLNDAIEIGWQVVFQDFLQVRLVFKVYLHARSGNKAQRQKTPSIARHHPFWSCWMSRCSSLKRAWASCPKPSWSQAHIRLSGFQSIAQCLFLVLAD